MISTDYFHIPIQKSKTIRKINKYMIPDFINKLSNESWDTIFNSDYVNATKNFFLNIYLRILYSIFPSGLIAIIIIELLQGSKHHVNMKGNCA